MQEIFVDARDICGYKISIVFSQSKKKDQLMMGQQDKLTSKRKGEMIRHERLRGFYSVL